MSSETLLRSLIELQECRIKNLQEIIKTQKELIQLLKAERDEGNSASLESKIKSANKHFYYTRCVVCESQKSKSISSRCLKCRSKK